MKDILNEIVENKIKRVEKRKSVYPLERLRADSLGVPESGRSMKKALAGSPTGIIAEFKRRSPSKGWIYQNAKAEEVVPRYEKAGASALSILTDTDFFGGAMADIIAARPLVNLPIIRKDFIMDEYQLYEARLIQADAVLLIAACLTVEKCNYLAAKAKELKLEVLLEIHNADELAYVSNDVDMVGVNNRNLGTFHTDVKNSFDLAERLPIGTVLVSESGISDPETVIALQKAGFKGFLIGETFMKTYRPGEALADFIDGIKPIL